MICMFKHLSTSKSVPIADFNDVIMISSHSFEDMYGLLL